MYIFNWKIRNKIEDILKEDKFKHNDGLLDEFNNFIDSINVINTMPTILLTRLLNNSFLKRLGA